MVAPDVTLGPSIYTPWPAPSRRDPSQRARQVLRNPLAAYKERVKGRPDSEHSQALLRIAIVCSLLIYTAWVAGHDPAGGDRLWAVNLFSAVFSILVFAAILRNPGASPPRRLIGALHDNLAVTIWLFLAGPLGALYLIGALLRRLQRVQEQLQRIASYDVLTGLPNRWLFMDKLSHALQRRHRGHLACLYLDLDGFKSVNDRLGHGVGDHLLKIVAEKVSGCVRRSDLPARLGGDEFAVVLDGLASPDDARAVATRLLETIDGITKVADHPETISTSVGVAFLPSGELSEPLVAEALLRAADEAMYRAKQAGKGQYRLIDVRAGG
jgi:diguanylate cyclase (GGDEF)-like protein